MNFSEKIYVIDASRPEVVATVPFADAPRPIAVHPSGDRLFVGRDGLLGFEVIDLAARRVVATAQYELTREEGDAEPVARHRGDARRARGVVDHINIAPSTPSTSPQPSRVISRDGHQVDADLAHDHPRRQDRVRGQRRGRHGLGLRRGRQEAASHDRDAQGLGAEALPGRRRPEEQPAGEAEPVAASLNRTLSEVPPPMLEPLVYDFGYSWPWTGGHLILLALFAVLVGVASWRRWPRWSW